MAHYQMSKSALSTMTRSLAYQLAPYNIRVNTVAPGLVQTEANREQWEKEPELWKKRSEGIPLKRTGLPADISGAVLYLASDKASWITWANLVIDGGMSLV